MSRPGSRLPPPPAGLLAHGDLLWPKAPGATILYLPARKSLEGSDVRQLVEKGVWEADQARFRDEGCPPDMDPDDFERLISLTYDAFRALYGEEGPQQRLKGVGGIPLSVGHVAIVDRRDDGDVQIIEAVIEGVIRRSYKDWAREHDRDLVWQGRLTLPAAPDAYVDEARSQIGKPYRFFSFNLLDDRGFYCSKLVWFAVFRAFGLPTDGKPGSSRGFWYSPRQLSRSPMVKMLQGAGPYKAARPPSSA